MNTPPERISVVRRWLVKAGNDLRNAQHTLTLPDPECPLDTVCFHAQQCAEKSMKALLTSEQISFEKTHDLGQLLFLCKPLPELVRELEEMKDLTHYAVDVRYLEFPMEEIKREEAVRAVALADRAYKIIQRQLESMLG